MLQARQTNPIAATQEMATEWGRCFFAMTQDQMDAADSELYKAIIATGVSHSVAMGYTLTAPLLVENEAISRYIVETGNLGLRSTMPEILTVAEALWLATAEYMLDEAQRDELQALFKKLVTREAAETMEERAEHPGCD